MQDYRVTRPKYRVPQEQGLAPFYRLSQVQGATGARIGTILQAVSGTGCHRSQDWHHSPGCLRYRVPQKPGYAPFYRLSQVQGATGFRICTIKGFLRYVEPHE